MKFEHVVSMRFFFRWLIIICCVFAASYGTMLMQTGAWVYPYHRDSREEALIYDLMKRASVAYDRSKVAKPTDPQRSLDVQEANYHLSAAVLNQLILMNRSELRQRQEISISFRGISFVLICAITLLVAMFAERLTRNIFYGRDS